MVTRSRMFAQTASVSASAQEQQLGARGIGGIRRPSRRMLLAGGAVLVAAIAAAVAVRPGDKPDVVAQPAAIEARARATSSVDDIIVFIVESEAQASQVRQAMSELNLFSADTGIPPVTPVIIVAGSDAQGSALQAYRDANDIRQAQGLPPIPVSDLTHP